MRGIREEFHEEEARNSSLPGGRSGEWKRDLFCKKPPSQGTGIDLDHCLGSELSCEWGRCARLVQGFCPTWQDSHRFPRKGHLRETLSESVKHPHGGLDSQIRTKARAVREDKAGLAPWPCHSRAGRSRTSSSWETVSFSFLICKTEIVPQKVLLFFMCKIIYAQDLAYRNN